MHVLAQLPFIRVTDTGTHGYRTDHEYEEPVELDDTNGFDDLYENVNDMGTHYDEAEA